MIPVRWDGMEARLDDFDALKCVTKLKESWGVRVRG